MKKNIFITGGSGYVGAMLCERFLKREDVDKVVTIDKDAPKDIMIDLLNKEEYKDRIVFIEKNLNDKSWKSEVERYSPNVVVHTAWQIREIYGDRQKSYDWNITASDNVFDFAYAHSSVERLVYFSTVASYGAFPENSIDHSFVETDKFRKTNYLYAEEKRWTEEHLEKKFEEYKDKLRQGGRKVDTYILRPAAITGPRGRVGRVRFGLQSALSGTLKGKSFVYNLVSLLTSFVPVTKNWLRQYIHEDDVTDIVALLSFDNLENKNNIESLRNSDAKGESRYEVFNISPAGECVLGPDMAAAVKKKYFLIHPQIVRMAFFILWHLTRGRIPTGEGSWKGYSYPIRVDGSKITKMFNYKYQFESKDAFVKNEGRYKVV